MTYDLELVDNRQCGGCTACCVYLPIAAGVVSPLAKPAGTSCPKLCAAGCGIYNHRPHICADFHCAWLATEGWPDAWRPDRAGVFCLREARAGQLAAAVMYEVRSGALTEPLAGEILDHLLRTSAVVVVVDLAQRRHRLLGQWRRVDPAETAVRPPRFLTTGAQQASA